MRTGPTALSGSAAKPPNGVVFLEDQLTVQVPVGIAAGRISAWLDGASELVDENGDARLGTDAYAAGNAELRRAGFAGITKEVAVQTLPPYDRGGTVVIVMRMVATGAAGYLFPVLDADLELSPLPDGATRMLLRGTYRPPLGSVGLALDRAVLHRAAKATVRRLLSQAGEVASEGFPLVLDPFATNG